MPTLERRLVTLSDFMEIEVPRKSGNPGVRFTITDTFIPLDENGKPIPGAAQTQTVPGNIFFVPPGGDGTPYWKPPFVRRGSMSYTAVVHSRNRWQEIFDALMKSPWADRIAKKLALRKEKAVNVYAPEGAPEVETIELDR